MDQPRNDHDYVGAPTPRRPATRGPNVVFQILKPIASLRLTIALFVISLLIVFFGTLAQKRDSLNTVLAEYFYCWVAKVDLNLISEFTQVFFQFRFLGTDEEPVRVPVPFVGGFLLGWAMVVNLTAAHIVRFKLSWKRAGIWALHAGMIVLLVGEFVRARYGVEDQMNLREGQSSNFLFSLDHVELVFLKTGAGDADEVVSVPDQLLKNAVGKPAITHLDLPFDIEVVRYMRNTGDPVALKAGETTLATAGLGKAVSLPEKKEVSSIKGEGRVNMPGCIVTLREKGGGAVVGTYVFGALIDATQAVRHGGDEWRAALRLKRTYLPYTVTAVKVERVNWPNTEKPKEFKSTVRIDNPETQEQREVVIQMNDPLRYDGATYYQSQMDRRGETNVTGLQVVRNPGSHVPYVACLLIAVGMSLHFSIKLIDFLNRRAAKS